VMSSASLRPGSSIRCLAMAKCGLAHASEPPAQATARRAVVLGCPRALRCPPVADADQTLRAWRADIRSGWGVGPHEATLDGLDKLLGELIAGEADPTEVLAKVGVEAGRAGHPLDQVWEWLQSLFARLPRAQRSALDQRDHAVTVATAWANGVLEADATAGPDRSPALLELRLRQLYDHCTSLGLAADAQFALVLVEVGGASPPAAWLPEMAAEATAALGRNEVVALLRPDRIAVVVARHPSLGAAVHHLQERLGELHALRGTTVRAWVEPLAPDPSHLAAHLAGLRA
jgi:hypothetical protein